MKKVNKLRAIIHLLQRGFNTRVNKIKTSSLFLKVKKLKIESCNLPSLIEITETRTDKIKTEFQNQQHVSGSPREETH